MGGKEQRITITQLREGLSDSRVSRLLARIERRFGDLTLNLDQVTACRELAEDFDPKKAANLFQQVTAGRGTAKSYCSEGLVKHPDGLKSGDVKKTHRSGRRIPRTTPQRPMGPIRRGR